MNSEGRIALIINLIYFPMVSLITHIRHNVVLVSINMDGEHKSGHSFKGSEQIVTLSQTANTQCLALSKTLFSLSKTQI